MTRVGKAPAGSSVVSAPRAVTSFMFDAGICGAVDWDENRTRLPSADRTWIATSCAEPGVGEPGRQQSLDVPVEVEHGRRADRSRARACTRACAGARRQGQPEAGTRQERGEGHARPSGRGHPGSLPGSYGHVTFPAPAGRDLAPASSSGDTRSMSDVLADHTNDTAERVGGGFADVPAADGRGGHRPVLARAARRLGAPSDVHAAVDARGPSAVAARHRRGGHRHVPRRHRSRRVPDVRPSGDLTASASPETITRTGAFQVGCRPLRQLKGWLRQLHRGRRSASSRSTPRSVLSPCWCSGSRSRPPTAPRPGAAGWAKGQAQAQIVATAAIEPLLDGRDLRAGLDPQHQGAARRDRPRLRRHQPAPPARPRRSRRLHQRRLRPRRGARGRGARGGRGPRRGRAHPAQLRRQRHRPGRRAGRRGLPAAERRPRRHAGRRPRDLPALRADPRRHRPWARRPLPAPRSSVSALST